MRQMCLALSKVMRRVWVTGCGEAPIAVVRADEHVAVRRPSASVTSNGRASFSISHSQRPVPSRLLSWPSTRSAL